MTAPRFACLWPILFRSSSSLETSVSKVASRHTLRAAPRAGFWTTNARRNPDTLPNQRYGSANEPPPHFSGDKPKVSPDTTTVRALPKPKDDTTPKTAKQAADSPSQQKDEETSTARAAPIEKPRSIAEVQKLHPNKEEKEAQDREATALSTILQMAPPLSEESQKPPHLRAPPYVHHFDTHTLVRRLQDGGWSEDQAVTIMKAVRASLADNMNLAQEGIVSKADSEMESYLFQAASAELKSEIQNNRRKATEQMRSERSQLQHEFDILSQRLSGESSNLKDDLKGMFDDRKMASRMERRKMENTIQELNYKITVALNSDTRSEIEGLRWVLTRRTAYALAMVVFMVLCTLRYASYMERKQELDRKKMEKMVAEGQGSFDYSVLAPAGKTGHGETEAVVGGDPSSLISLG